MARKRTTSGGGSKVVRLPARLAVVAPPPANDVARAAPPRTFRALASPSWEALRAHCAALRPILAPAIDRVADWPVPPNLQPTAALVIDLAHVYLTHVPLVFLRGPK